MFPYARQDSRKAKNGLKMFSPYKENTKAERQRMDSSFRRNDKSRIGRAGALSRLILNCMPGFQGTGYCKYTDEKSTYHKNAVKTV
jgi:hypothetical protein